MKLLLLHVALTVAAFVAPTRAAKEVRETLTTCDVTEQPTFHMYAQAFVWNGTREGSYSVACLYAANIRSARFIQNIDFDAWFVGRCPAMWLKAVWIDKSGAMCVRYDVMYPDWNDPPPYEFGATAVCHCHTDVAGSARTVADWMGVALR